MISARKSLTRTPTKKAVTAPSLIVVAGDSAGGGLGVAAMVAARGAGLPMPAGAALMSPWTDLSNPARSWERREKSDVTLTVNGLRTGVHLCLSERDARTPLASPFYADLRGLPPLYIQVGGAELLLDDIQAFAVQARTAGV